MHDIVKKKDWYFPTAYSLWGDEERGAIDRVLTSGRLTMGEEVEAFEEAFAVYHKMKYGVMVNSGSSANLIMVAALFAKKDRPLRRGDRVLVPALAWSTTYAPLVQYGLQIKLADCDATWCAGPTDVSGCRLVVGCSILGNPAPINFFKIAAESQDNYFVEDNCESLGAWHGNELCGTMGLMSTASFYYSHQISAVEGGMILTNDPECARLCRVLRAHGWTRDVQHPVTFDEEYNFTHHGYNVRPTEMHAAIAREQLKKLDGFIVARQGNHDKFAVLTRSLPIRMPRPRGEISPFGLPFTVASSEVRSRLVAALRVAGIDCRLPTGGSYRLHPYGASVVAQETPIADKIHETGLFLGNGPLDLSDQIATAVNVMEHVL